MHSIHSHKQKEHSRRKSLLSKRSINVLAKKNSKNFESHSDVVRRCAQSRTVCFRNRNTLKKTTLH